MRQLAAVLAGAAVVAVSGHAHAQFAVPEMDSESDPAIVFVNQCGTCHALKPAEQRQGPPLGGVIGRRAGSVPGFAYTAGFARADWIWDAARLDAWLTNPQAMIPGAAMTYQQSDPGIRHVIIAYLQEQP